MKKLITIILVLIMTFFNAPQKGADQPHVTAEKPPHTAITITVATIITATMEIIVMAATMITEIMVMAATMITEIMVMAATMITVMMTIMVQITTKTMS